jgi:hypothetical protein
MLCILNFVYLVICFPKCLRIAPFILLYVWNLSSNSLLYSDIQKTRKIFERKNLLFKITEIMWLVFKAEIECVYCAVRTESLNINEVNISVQKVQFQYVDTKLVQLYCAVCVYGVRFKKAFYMRYCRKRAATMTWFEARAQMSCWGQRSMEWVSRCVARCGEGTDCCLGPGTTRTRLIPIRRSVWHLNIRVSEIRINL